MQLLSCMRGNSARNYFIMSEVPLYETSNQNADLDPDLDAEAGQVMVQHSHYTLIIMTRTLGSDSHDSHSR